MQSLKNSWQCFFSFIACIIFMTGCGQQTPESTAAPQTSIPQTASEQRKGLTSLQNADGFVYGATTEEGFYHVQESDEADGSLNIYYTDYSSLQTVILCSQPNCNHHSESCTGWVPYTGNGVSLMAVGEQLVLVYPGGSGTDKDGTPMFPRIQTADPDGNNRRTVVSFEANQEFFGPYLTDGKSLYARQDTYTDQGCDSALVAVDLETGEASTIFSLNSDEGDAIWGAADEFVFVRHMEIDENGAISGTQLDRVNINTQEKRSVYHWDSLGQRVMLFGSTLICYTASTNELSRVDCLSGERTLLAQNALPQNAETGNVNLIWYDDGTPAGTYLTTWKTTNHATQAWTKKVSADGKYAFVCANNEWVAININRSNYSRANVYTLAGNYYADVAISTKVNSGRIILSVDGRGSYSSASLRVSSTATPANDGNNTSKYCEWSRTGGTSFYEDDWISARSARLLIR